MSYEPSQGKTYVINPTFKMKMDLVTVRVQPFQWCLLLNFQTINIHHIYLHHKQLQYLASHLSVLVQSKYTWNVLWV